MNPVVHFEMPADDSKRMSEFYAKAFGWRTTQLGAEMGNYIIVTTTETDEKRMIKTPGTINGGFFRRTKSDQHPSVVISVDNIREGMKKVEEAGGTILGGMNPGEPDDIPGVGFYCSFLDSEGNKVGMIQSKGM